MPRMPQPLFNYVAYLSKMSVHSYARGANDHVFEFPDGGLVVISQRLFQQYDRELNLHRAG